MLRLVPQVWLPSLGTLDGADELKRVLVATAKCLAELPPLQVRTAMSLLSYKSSPDSLHHKNLIPNHVPSLARLKSSLAR